MRKDIVIEVKTPSRQYGGGEKLERLDTYTDQKMTLQFISNILSGIDNITRSSTLSVKLPRTAKNEGIFDFATRPQYDSAMTHRKIDCRVYINGIDMMKEAYCYLLDCESDSYEIAIVFGLLQNYGQWLTERPGLRDLDDRGEFILWNGKCAIDCGSTWWSNFPSRYTSALGINAHNFASQFYALYDCGFERNSTTLNYFNLHPCVSMREIYERIISENNLNFVMPTSVLLDMENLAIVQVERNQPEQGDAHPTDATPNSADNVHSAGYGRLQAEIGGLCGRIDIPTSDYYKVAGRCGYWLYYGEGSVTIDFDFNLRPISAQNEFGLLFYWLLSLYNSLNYIYLVFYDYTTGTIRKFAPFSYASSGNLVTIRYKGSITFTNTDNLSEGSTLAEMAIWIDPRVNNLGPTVSNILGYYFHLGYGAGNEAFDAGGVQQLTVGYTFDLAHGFQYTYIEGTTPYPNNFLLIPNLPDISQIDFIKAICQIYCLFPVANSSDNEQIDFVPFDIFRETYLNAYDWSDKLLEYGSDVPRKISFKAGDYAKNNIIRYKDDDNEKYPFHSEASLMADDDTLDEEKVIVEFPWAATKVDRITQYQRKISENDQSQQKLQYEFIPCEYRLVRITEWHRQSDCANVAKFQDLDAEYLLATYYSTYQATIAKPRIITEHIRLNELEMRDIDFTRPVYLRKYGRFYAIKQIQWTVGDDYAECELLQL